MQVTDAMKETPTPWHAPSWQSALQTVRINGNQIHPETDPLIPRIFAAAAAAYLAKKSFATGFTDPRVRMQLFANAASQPLLAVVTKALLAADLATVVSTDAHCTILDIDVPKGTKAIDMSQMTPAGASIVGHCLPNSAIARVLYRNVPQKITKEGLLSHKIHGVDNTGQARVWDSELLSLLFFFRNSDGRAVVDGAIKACKQHFMERKHSKRPAEHKPESVDEEAVVEVGVAMGEMLLNTDVLMPPPPPPADESAAEDRIRGGGFDTAPYTVPSDYPNPWGGAVAPVSGSVLGQPLGMQPQGRGGRFGGRGGGGRSGLRGGGRFGGRGGGRFGGQQPQMQYQQPQMQYQQPQMQYQLQQWRQQQQQQEQRQFNPNPSMVQRGNNFPNQGRGGGRFPQPQQSPYNVYPGGRGQQQRGPRGYLRGGGLGFGCFVKARSPPILRVVELGAGMAGLAGLAMASHSRCHPGFFENIDVDVLLTDGHPAAVFNNAVSAHLTSSLPGKGGAVSRYTNVRAAKLLWKEGEEGKKECELLTKGRFDSDYNLFHLCVVSDCVHFQESHAALISTMARLLSLGGQAVLMQPDRADSVRNFLAMVGAVNGLFSVNVIEKFDDDVWDQHLSNLADDAMKEVYDPALHMPKVIVLTKVREFDEEVDGAVLRETREEREVEKERVREAKKKERLNK